MDPNTFQLWLWLNAQDPRMLDATTRAQLAALRQLMDRRMAADPLGLYSMTPPPPSFLQQRAYYQANLPQIPFVERFPPPSYTTPSFGQNPHLKSGVEPLSTIEPMTGASGVQWRL